MNYVVLAKAVLSALWIAFIPAFFVAMYYEVLLILFLVVLTISLIGLVIIFYDEFIQEEKEKRAKAAFLSAPDGVEW